MHLATSRDHVTYSSVANKAEEMHVLVFPCELKMVNVTGTMKNLGGSF